MKPAQAHNRHDWVDFAKGICMLAVVLMYINSDLRREVVRANPGTVVDDSAWFQFFISFAKPFRMPDFFLLSGLFLGRVMNRPWRSYLDSRVVHYLYFFVLWTAILLLVRSAGSIFRGDVAGLPGEFIEWLYEPFAMLWFIEILAIYSLLTRLANRVPVWLMFGLTAALQIAQYHSEWELLKHFGERYVYFFAGYAFASSFFKLNDWVNANKGKACLALLAWAVVNGLFVYLRWADLRGVSLILGFAGACAVMMTARLLCELPWTRWLRYMGEHSLMIYLGFYVPMSLATQLIARKPGWMFDYGVVAILITIFSITCALLQYWAVRYTPAKFLFVRPTWARLVPEKSAPAGALNEAKAMT